MIGGYSINNKLDGILKMYSNIPDSGLFNNIETQDNLSKNLVLFKKYCKFILNNTKDDKIYQLLQKKFITNMKINKTKNIQYILKRLKISNQSSIRMIETKIDDILDKTEKNRLKKKLNIILKKFHYIDIVNQLSEETKKMGKYYMKVGHDFEKQVSNTIIPIVAKQLNYNVKELILIENALLKIRKNNEIILIGEIDVIVLDKKNNNIVAVGEIKKSFDDISDALFQINRTFENIKNKNVFLELNGKIYSNDIFKNIKSMTLDELLKHSFIFTEYDINKKYKKIPSKLSMVLLQILWSGNINNISSKFYKKLFLRIKKKQKNRYISNAVNTIEQFKIKNLLDRIILN